MSVTNLEIPAEAQEALDENGDIQKLQHTLLRIWLNQAESAVQQLAITTKLGFSYAVQTSLRLNLDEKQLKTYAAVYIQTARDYWQVIIDAAKEHPSALELPEDGEDGEVNRLVYIGINNTWLKKAWELNNSWDLEDGLAAAYAIFDATEEVLGDNGVYKHPFLLPGFSVEQDEVWTPEELS